MFQMRGEPWLFAQLLQKYRYGEGPRGHSPSQTKQNPSQGFCYPTALKVALPQQMARHWTPERDL